MSEEHPWFHLLMDSEILWDFFILLNFMFRMLGSLLHCSANMAELVQQLCNINSLGGKFLNRFYKYFPSPAQVRMHGL